MSAAALHEAGYGPLVSVIPPGAKLSPRSKIKPSMLGKVPGKLGKHGWYGYDFVREPLTDYEIKRLEKWGANVGLLGDRFPAMDVDVEDEKLASVIAARAAKAFGPAPERASRGARRLFVYRTEEPFPRRALEIEYKGAKHVVEFLGKGRQYLVYGTHPSGVEYTWDGTALWDCKPSVLPLISAQDVDDFLEQMKNDLEAKDIPCHLSTEGPKSEKLVPPQEDLAAPSIEVLEEAVARIPNDDTFPERDDYIAFGCAIKAAGGDDAAYIYQDWCARWDGGENDPETVADDWARMHPPFRTGWPWIKELAGLAAEDEFEVLADAPPEPPKEEPRQVALTDEDFVHRLLPVLRDSVCYVPGKTNGTWWVWAGHVWVEDLKLEAETRIRALLREEALSLERQGRAGGKEGAPLRAAARRIQSAAGIKAVIGLLKAKLAISIEQFDREPWWLNTPEGVLDLRNRTRRESRPGDYLAKSTTVSPKEGPAPLWSAFLEKLTGGDAELEGFLRRYMGYCLTSDISAKVLVFAWGSNTDTGKSTFVRTVRAILGSYARTTNVQAFMSASKRDVPDNIAQLVGVRLTTATEPGQGQEWNDEMLKAILGDDEIQVRKFFGSWFDFRPQFKIFIAGNHEPELKQVTDSMRRRILIVPMNQKVPLEEQISRLDEKMVEQEGAAILAWMVRGCVEWQAEGLRPPEAVRATTDRYWQQMDTLGRWVLEQCELRTGAQSSRADLYHAWAQWCRSNGHRPGNDLSFKQDLDARLTEFGIQEARFRQGDSYVRGYEGITLRDDMEVVV